LGEPASPSFETTEEAQMADLPPPSTRWLADHHGVITTATLREHGVRRATRRRLVAAGLLRTVAKGVYVITTAPVTLEQRCAILSAVHPGGFVTGPTAGMLAGLRRMPRSSPLHFSMHHGVHIVQDTGIRFRQTTVIWSIDRLTRPDGIIVASWPRLAFDLAADVNQLDHVSVVQQLLHERKVTADELVAIDRRLGHPTRPGSGVFRRTLETLDPSPNESHPEVVLADALRRRDVPVEHQAQVVRASNGRTARVDLAVPNVRWGIELDIHPEHGTFDGRARDARRRRDCHFVGWQIETVTELDMLDVDTLTDELVGLYHARRIQSSAS
jgi:hypothetical protein